MPNAIAPASLSVFQQQLIGTWTNQNLPGVGKGDTSSPYSYCVMVLPQQSPQGPPPQNTGYILKNFTLYEKINFKGPSTIAAPASASNRGGTYQQTAYALFYDQQVRFAEGPGLGKLTHEENGAWLHLQTEPQQIGPYLWPTDNPAHEVGPVPPQPPNLTICKQISVPHGNSVLAQGNFQVNAGSPAIPNADPVLPTPQGLDTTPYSNVIAVPGNYQNPDPQVTQNIALPLQRAVSDLEAAGRGVTDHIFCQVDTNTAGGVLNTVFEDRKATVVGYDAQYWLLSCDGGKSYDILAYAQRILLSIRIGGTLYAFPHPTCNVLSRVHPG
jgi:hypothetical protein